MNRRGILGVLAGAPFASKVIADEASNAMLPIPPSGAAYGLSSQSAGQAPAAPFMERSTAIQMIFSDTKALAEVRDELYEQNRIVSYIDPDIMAIRSFSPMAKVTFQRQRNVERAMEEVFNPRWDMPQRYVQAISKRLDKLMWGR